MMKSGTLFLISALLLLVSCNKYDANGKLIKYEELDHAKWLLGHWEAKDSLGALTESWEILDDSTFAGETFFITPKKDTLHKEVFELMQSGKFLIYTTTVKGENNDEPTAFQLRENIDSVLVFENPKHNYPKKIKYQLRKDNRIAITISGTQNGKKYSDHYQLEKINQ